MEDHIEDGETAHETSSFNSSSKEYEALRGLYDIFIDNMQDPDRVSNILFAEGLIPKHELPGESERSARAGKIMKNVLAKVAHDPQSVYQFIKALKTKTPTAGSSLLVSLCDKLEKKLEIVPTGMATGRTVTLNLVYGKLKARLKNVPSDISLADLRERAAKRFPLSSEQMTFQYFEDNQWFVWYDDGLTNGQELKVMQCDVSGNIIEEEDIGTAETDGNSNGQVQSSSQRQDASISGWIKRIDSKLQENKPQGIVFIVSMFDTKESEKDIFSMQQVFAKLNFVLCLEHNLNPEDMKDLAQAIARYPFPAQIYIAFYYAGHGGISKNGDAIFKPVQTSDEKDFVFVERDIIWPIENGQKNKCLLFFFDCCLSNAKGIAEDATPVFTPTHPNSLIACASSFDKTSSGGYKTGGNWTQTLCKHLEENDSLVNILNTVSIKVYEEYRQKSTLKHNLTTVVNLKGASEEAVGKSQSIPGGIGSADVVTITKCSRAYTKIHKNFYFILLASCGAVFAVLASSKLFSNEWPMKRDHFPSFQDFSSYQIDCQNDMYNYAKLLMKSYRKIDTISGNNLKSINYYIPHIMIRSEHKVHGNAHYEYEDMKEKLELTDLFKPAASHDERIKFIVVTGRQGIGKSTLALEIARHWKKFSNHSLAILVKLQESKSQSAKHVNDLYIEIDFVDMKKVKKCIAETGGDGVLWILDGFDELHFDQQMLAKSIYHKMFRKSVLPKSTILVTSRHSAIAQLNSYMLLESSSSRHIDLLSVVFYYYETYDYMI